MAMTVVKDIHENYSYRHERDASFVTLCYTVEGTEVNVSDGAAYALDEVATNHAPMTVTPEGSVRVLKRKVKSTKRIGPEMVKVYVDYEWQRDGSHDDTGPEEEVDRGNLYNVPFNEKMSMVGEEEQIFFEVDANGNMTGRPIGVTGEGYSIYVPRITWSFDVIVRPDYRFWTYIDKYNTSTFPATGSGQYKRPFYFGAGTLLYLGAESRMAKREEIDDASGNPYTWAWLFNFKFLFNPDGWQFYKWFIEDSIDPTEAGANPLTLYYRNPFDSFNENEVQYDQHMRVKLYQKVGGQPQLYFSSKVRTGANFSDWGFNWTYGL